MALLFFCMLQVCAFSWAFYTLVRRQRHDLRLFTDAATSTAL
jgi:hypothetical protein